MTIRTHAATDDYRSGWELAFKGSRPIDPDAQRRRTLAIARVECRKLLPTLPANPELHVAIPLWALRALVGEP